MSCVWNSFGNSTGNSFRNCTGNSTGNSFSSSTRNFFRSFKKKSPVVPTFIGLMSSTKKHSKSSTKKIFRILSGHFSGSSTANSCSISIGNSSISLKKCSRIYVKKSAESLLGIPPEIHLDVRSRISAGDTKSLVRVPSRISTGVSQ